MAKYENPAELDYRNGGDTVDDFAQKYMRTVDYIIKALNDLRTPTGNTAGVEPEPYMWRIADNKLYIRNADNTDYVLLGDISPNFGFRQSVNDRFLTTADLEGDGAVVTRNEAGKVEGDITGSPGKIANKTIDVTPTADNDVIAYDAAQQKWVKKTLNDYLKKQGDAGWDEMVDEVADQVIEDITPIIFNFWYLDDDGYLVPLVGSTEGGLPSIHGMVGDYEQITARSVDVAGNLSATGNVTAGMVTTPQANVTTLTANAVNAQSASVTEISAEKVTAGNAPVYSIGDFDGETNEDRLHNALSTITEGTLYCGKINVTKSFDVASTNADYRQVTIAGANITVTDTPLFTSSNPNGQYGVINSVPSFVNCDIKGNNSTPLFDDFNVITTKFDSCKIIGCPIINSTTHYIQSLFLNNCDILSMDANMASAKKFYNLNMSNCRVERGNGKLFICNALNDHYGIVNGSITNSLIEGRGDSIIYSKGGFLPLVIKNCYFEGNAYPYIEVDSNNPVVANTYVEGCYFNIDTMTTTDRVFKYNNSGQSSMMLIENNFFEKGINLDEKITIYDSSRSIASDFCKKINNRLPTNVILQSTNFNFGLNEYRPTVESDNLVVRVPLNSFSNLWMINTTLDIDFFARKAESDSVIIRDYINLKLVLIVTSGNMRVSPIVVSTFKTNESTNVTATIENDAYNSKNGVLVLSFSGFYTESTQYDICKIRNNNIASMWEH